MTIEATVPLVNRLRNFVRDPEFPCVGAKAALARGTMRIVVARDIASAWDDLRILPELTALAADYRAEPTLFQSLIVIFEDSATMSEAEF